jgi:hypothetical protein
LQSFKGLQSPGMRLMGEWHMGFKNIAFGILLTILIAFAIRGVIAFFGGC